MPGTRSGKTYHRQCKDQATSMSETTRPGKAYLDLCKDETTAVRESIRLLREIEIRSHRAAILCYETSSKNESSYIAYAVIASIVTAIVGILTYQDLLKKTEEALPAIVSYIIDAPVAAACIVSILGIIIVGLVPSAVLQSYYKDRTTRYNEAAAGWQALELKIRAFLATKIEGRVSADECKSFLDECIAQREKICLTARPDAKIYKNYQKDMTIYKQNENVNKLHDIRIENGWY